MNNKKGEFKAGIGLIIMTAITLIVGLILLSDGIAGNVAQVSQQVTVHNVTYTAAANGAVIDLTGQEYITGVTVYNQTGASGLVYSGNFTIGEGVSTSTGVKTVTLRTDSAHYAGVSVNLSYTYGVEGYADNSGARSMAAIIPIFVALALLVAAIYPVLKERWGD